MGKGWDATGRLELFWGRLGGRDGLAKQTGIHGTTLSNYNAGQRPLGIRNGIRIAQALKVSVLELGAPEEMVDERGRSLLDHQRELEAQVDRLAKQVRRLTGRVRILEHRFPPGSAEGETA